MQWLIKGCFVASLLLFASGSPGFGQDTAWFSGGTHDGYDVDLVFGELDFPLVSNLDGATNVTPTNAWLNGMLIDTGAAPAEVHVYWGKTDGGTIIAAWSNVWDFGEREAFELLSVQVDVDEQSLYYYRFYATNTAGEEGWAVESSEFLTPAPPSVSTGLGAIFSVDWADLHGELTGGREALVWMEWGETTGEGDVPDPGDLTTIDLSTRTEDNPPGAPVQNPFVARIDGLTAETPHAYRVCASNEWGETESPWVWFTTMTANFMWTTDLGWYGGGYYDGYDMGESHEKSMPGWSSGTIFSFH